MKGPFTADPAGILDGDGLLVAEVPVEHRRYVLDALNAKWERENRCRARWHAGVLCPPGVVPIPDGARCRLARHGPEVEHQFRAPPEEP